MNFTPADLQNLDYFLNKVTLQGTESIVLAQLQVKIRQELQTQQQVLKQAEDVVNKKVGDKPKEQKNDK